jgi:capsid protein
MLAIYMKKTQKVMGSKPNTGGAVKRGTVTVSDVGGSTRTLNVAEQIPGVVFDELQYGEEPVSFGSTGTDEKFGTFEEAIIQAVAWANEVPPEILRLAFSNNYSASQAAINEFKIYLNKIWSDFGESFCQTIHTEWLLSEVLNQKIIAPGLLDYWRDKTKYDLFGAYTATEWYGSIKPSTDMLKQAKGSKLLIDMALTTHTRESRNTTGTSFNKNVKRLKREIELLLDARKPLVEFEAQLKQTSTNTKDPAAEKFEEISAQIEDLKDEIEDLKDEITNEGGNK